MVLCQLLPSQIPSCTWPLFHPASNHPFYLAIQLFHCQSFPELCPSCSTFLFFSISQNHSGRGYLSTSVLANTLPISTRHPTRHFGHILYKTPIFISQFFVSISICLIFSPSSSLHLENVTHHSISRSQCNCSHVSSTPCHKSIS